MQRALVLAYTEQAEELRRLQRLDQALILAERAVALKADEPAALYTRGDKKRSHSSMPRTRP